MTIQTNLPPFCPQTIRRSNANLRTFAQTSGLALLTADCFGLFIDKLATINPIKRGFAPHPAAGLNRIYWQICNLERVVGISIHDSHAG